MLSDTSLATPAALQPVAAESNVAMRRIALALFFGFLCVGAPAATAAFGLGLYQWGGFGVASVAVVVAPAIAIAIACGAPLARGPVGSPVRLSAILGRIWLGGISLALQGVGFAVLSAFSTLYFNSRGWAHPALAMSLFGGGYALIRLMLGQLPDRLGGFTVAGASMTVEFMGQVLLWLAPNEFTALLGAALSGAGCSLVFPSLGVEALRIIPPQARATTMGTFVAFQDIAYGISAPLVGTLIGMHGYRSVFMVGAAAGFIGVLTVMLAKYQSASFSSASKTPRRPVRREPTPREFHEQGPGRPKMTNL